MDIFATVTGEARVTVLGYTPKNMCAGWTCLGSMLHVMCLLIYFQHLLCLLYFSIKIIQKDILSEKFCVHSCEESIIRKKISKALR